MVVVQLSVSKKVPPFSDHKIILKSSFKPQKVTFVLEHEKPFLKTYKLLVLKGMKTSLKLILTRQWRLHGISLKPSI